jgi:Cephalosporin hydroxylase.
MTIYKSLLQKLWRGGDPYVGFPYRTVKPDLQGWQSQHRYLAETVGRSRPGIVVEIGVWKGGSCLELARAIQANHLDGAVVAVDTWLGSSEHWERDDWHGEWRSSSVIRPYTRLSWQT